MAETPHLHGRVYQIEVDAGSGWKPAGDLTLSAHGVALSGVELSQAAFVRGRNALSFAAAGGAGTSGHVSLTNDLSALVGTMTSAGNDLVAVRGTLTTVFQTKIGAETGRSLTISTYFDEQGVIQKQILLADCDVSSRTAVTKVDQTTLKTTLEMVADNSNPLSPSKDGFQIVIEPDGQQFAGTYWSDVSDKAHGKPWTGQAFASPRTALGRVPAARVLDARADLAATGTAGLGVQEIMSFSVIGTVIGEGKTIDTAQAKTSEYFQKVLINSLDPDVVTGVFGRPYDVPDRVAAVGKKYASFCKSAAVPNLGAVLLAGQQSLTEKDALKRINAQRVNDFFQYLGCPSKAPDAALKQQLQVLTPGYQGFTQDLYLQAYRNVVPGMEAYLADQAQNRGSPDHDWGKRFFDYVTSDALINIWRVQIASSAFDNVREHLYEIYVKLSLLAPGQGYAEAASKRLFAELLDVVLSQVSWTGDPTIRAFLDQAIHSVLDGEIPDFGNDAANQAARQAQATLQEMAVAAGGVQLLSQQIMLVMSQSWRPQRFGTAVATAGDEVLGKMVAAGPKFKKFTAVGGGVLSVVLYAAACGYSIYQMTQDVKSQKFTPASFIGDTGLALSLLGLLTKGGEKVVQVLRMTRLAAWLEKPLADGASALSSFARGMASWFTKDGVKATGWVTKIFGQSSAEFFARRLGPALAVVGVVMSGLALADAIQAHDVRDIVFDSVLAFGSLLDVTMIGLSMVGFAWAGPVGLAIAVVGALIMLAQLIWELADPPKPPPDPIEKFIAGPLHTAGFAT